MPRSKPLTLLLTILSVLILSARMSAETGTPQEMAAAKRQRQPAFSFVYDGRPSRSFLSEWKSSESRKPLGSDRTEVTRSFLDPRTGLEVRCVSVEYGDFPAVEWTVTLTNKGRTKTALLKDISGLDMRLPAAAKGPAVLHWMRGDDNTGQSFAPRERSFASGRPDSMTLAPNGGKSSDGVAPFFNLAWEGGGVAVAVGWTGQWEATAAREADGAMSLRAGQQLTNLVLEPGETVRTPRILLVFWAGSDPLRGTNLFRQLLIKHVLPSAAASSSFRPSAPASMRWIREGAMKALMSASCRSWPSAASRSSGPTWIPSSGIPAASPRGRAPGSWTRPNIRAA